ncbi:MAG: hypothetical protein ACK46A_13430 [Akkermansiaceae bacterium]|jgi:hypothetical protein|nr:hypothetical protein [Luteolibacter sp.]
MPKNDFQVIGPIPDQRLKNDARIIPEASYDASGLWDFGPQAYDETFFKTTPVRHGRLSNSGKPPINHFLTVGSYRPQVPLCAPKRFFGQIPEDQIQLPVVKVNDRDDISSITKEILINTWIYLKAFR